MRFAPLPRRKRRHSRERRTGVCNLVKFVQNSFSCSSVPDATRWVFSRDCVVVASANGPRYDDVDAKRSDAMRCVINRPRVVSQRHLQLTLEPSLFEHTRLTPPYDASRDFRRAEKNRVAPVFVPRRDERRGGRGIRRRRKGTFVMTHSFHAANATRERAH